VRARKTRRPALWALALALAAGFAGLGRWQWQRGLQKQAWVDAQAAALAERSAKPLAVLSRADDATLAWAEGRGRFAEAPALLLDNQRRGDAVGVREYRVFVPDGGRALLVDLGWQPLPPDRTLPSAPPLPGDHTLRGLLAPPPSAGFALGPDHTDAGDRRWLLTRIDRAALAAALRIELAPRVLRLDPALPLGHARDLEPLANTLPPERHRGYAVQWFALSAATLVVALVLSFRRRRA
jgi:cytochrome oxidase assembly protein ShyY1